MKANELMIGDWVNVKSNGVVPDSIMKIITLDTGFDPERPTCFAKPICEYEDCDNELGLDELKPIPITPEILEKNGFSDRGKAGWQNPDYDATYYLDGYMFSKNVYKRTLDDSVLVDVIHGIKYVHELQHALRLCGLNELADNFKV